MRTPHTRLSMQEYDVRNCFADVFAYKWSYDQQWVDAFIHPFSVRQILVDAICLKIMPIAGLRVRCLCGAEQLCAAQKNRKRADTIKHTRDSVRKYHDARRNFWIAPIGYVESTAALSTRASTGRTLSMHTPSYIPFNTVELHWHSSCLGLDSSRKRYSKYF